MTLILKEKKYILDASLNEKECEEKNELIKTEEN